MANPAAETIYVTLFAGTLIMLVLSCALILFIVFYHRRNLRRQAEVYALQADHQRALLESVLHAVENERRRFAQDLHDEIGGALSALRMQLSRLATRPAQHDLDEIAGVGKEVVDSAVESVRRIAYDMLPPGLEVFGLGYAASELCKRTEAMTKLSILFNGDPELRLGNKHHELMLYKSCSTMLLSTVQRNKLRFVLGLCSKVSNCFTATTELVLMLRLPLVQGWDSKIWKAVFSFSMALCK
jgi:two-component system, NarL family, sensor kinase